MTANSDRAFSIIAELEGGGKVNVDSGGITKWGIAQRFYPNLNIAELTYDDAEKIFERDYWNLVDGDDLPWPLSAAVADAAFNEGPGTAIMLLQKALGGVAVDGRLGRQTLQAVSAANPRDLLASFLTQRTLRYQGTRGYDVSGKGWLNRLHNLAVALGQSSAS